MLGYIYWFEHRFKKNKQRNYLEKVFFFNFINNAVLWKTTENVGERRDFNPNRAGLFEDFWHSLRFQEELM